MKENEIINQISKVYGEDRKIYLQELMKLKENWTSWEKLTKEIKKATGQPVEGHCELCSDVIEWILNNNKKKSRTPKFEYIHSASYHYRIVLTENVKSPLDWGFKLATKCGGTVHFCDLRVSMILPYYTIDKFYLKYSKKENWFEDGTLSKLSVFENSTIKQIKNSMNKKGFSYLNKKIAGRRIRNAFTDINCEGNASVYDCLFSDLYEYFGYRTKFSDKEINDVVTGAKVRWFEYYDSKNVLTSKSVISEFPSGDVTKTIFDNKGSIRKLTVWPSDTLKEINIDVGRRINRMKQQ